MMRGQRGSRSAPTLPELRRDRDRRRAVLASIRAADDGLETALESDEILACFEEALGERQPDMGTDAAAGREANAESVTVLWAFICLSSGRVAITLAAVLIPRLIVELDPLHRSRRRLGHDLQVPRYDFLPKIKGIKSGIR
ncbi:hypothetical protein EMIHUDRAFT_200814 [Emiliania huxleyi CCMP1516]|uniref:Uncharacterized protein n=2 Tax=Emiliania huxleyi TaxID=2903 RepID=A0A0D3KR70_EMIH1|nr:hypothetical protein EMIHUDRAFT_200814 [Emiliania huxleyi CCMP1516]EOD38255.1 hypothetical protein EMIHUDRAFT_200814 [Emiliania huxleyi CCMP1516]|eukprot:XP_005790684.1 hypothetical protein EMIHUDRAFT_200814 [Emiliania huxleyi CCMP1516]